RPPRAGARVRVEGEPVADFGAGDADPGEDGAERRSGPAGCRARFHAARPPVLGRGVSPSGRAFMTVRPTGVPARTTATPPPRPPRTRPPREATRFRTGPPRPVLRTAVGRPRTRRRSPRRPARSPGPPVPAPRAAGRGPSIPRSPPRRTPRRPGPPPTPAGERTTSPPTAGPQPPLPQRAS